MNSVVALLESVVLTVVAGVVEEPVEILVVDEFVGGVVGDVVDEFPVVSVVVLIFVGRTEGEVNGDVVLAEFVDVELIVEGCVVLVVDALLAEVVVDGAG